MKGLKKFSLVRGLVISIVLLAALIAVVWAQRPASKDLESKEEEKGATKVERFLSRKGVLIVRDYHSIGSLEPRFGNPIELKAIKLYTPGEEKNAHFGVRFEREASERYGSDSIVWLDYNEAKDVAKSLSYMKDMATKMANKSVEYTEVEFRTKGDFSVGFYQSGTNQKAFARLSRYGSDALAHFQMSQMQELHDLVESAVQKLQTLGAK